MHVQLNRDKLKGTEIIYRSSSLFPRFAMLSESAEDPGCFGQVWGPKRPTALPPWVMVSWSAGRPGYRVCGNSGRSNQTLSIRAFVLQILGVWVHPFTKSHRTW